MEGDPISAHAVQPHATGVDGGSADSRKAYWMTSPTPCHRGGRWQMASRSDDLKVYSLQLEGSRYAPPYCLGVEAIELGIDESGTGALAGPFMVAGVALPRGVNPPGFNDSKKLTDKKRRKLISVIRSHAVWGICVEVPVARINQGPRQAWREAIYRIVERASERFSGKWGRTIVDGPGDATLNHTCRNVPGIQFIPKADQKYSTVMAASILAKTIRNDRMIEIHKRFPAYGFSLHTGYGTSFHMDAIESMGACIEHRNVNTKRFSIREGKLAPKR